MEKRKISELHNHKCKAGRKGHKSLSNLPIRSAKLRLNDLIEQTKKTGEETEEKSEVVALKVAELLLLDAKSHDQKKLDGVGPVDNLFHSVPNNPNNHRSP